MWVDVRIDAWLLRICALVAGLVLGIFCVEYVKDGEIFKLHG